MVITHRPLLSHNSKWVELVVDLVEVELLDKLDSECNLNNKTHFLDRISLHRVVLEDNKTHLAVKVLLELHHQALGSNKISHHLEEASVNSLNHQDLVKILEEYLDSNKTSLLAKVQQMLHSVKTRLVLAGNSSNLVPQILEVCLDNSLSK